LPPTLDGLLVQDRDLGEQPISTRTNPVGLNRDIPATLLFIQATEQEIHLAMQDLVGMRRLLLARGTLTLMNLWC
jgi:hypothetical protein